MHKPLTIHVSDDDKTGNNRRTEVKVIRVEFFQRIKESLFGVLLIGVVELGDEEEIATSDTRSFDTLTNFTLVLVCSSGINVRVAVLESDLNRLLDGTRLGLPGTCVAKD